MTFFKKILFLFLLFPLFCLGSESQSPDLDVFLRAFKVPGVMISGQPLGEQGKHHYLQVHMNKLEKETPPSKMDMCKRKAKLGLRAATIGLSITVAYVLLSMVLSRCLSDPAELFLRDQLTGGAGQINRLHSIADTLASDGGPNGGRAWLPNLYPRMRDWIYSGFLGGFFKQLISRSSVTVLCGSTSCVYMLLAFLREEEAQTPFRDLLEAFIADWPEHRGNVPKQFCALFDALYAGFVQKDKNLVFDEEYARTIVAVVDYTLLQKPKA